MAQQLDEVTKMDTNDMIQALWDTFYLTAVHAKDFDSSYTRGLWIISDIKNGLTGYKGYADATLDDNFLNSWLSSHGWYAEPNSAFEIFIYKKQPLNLNVHCEDDNHET